MKFVRNLALAAGAVAVFAGASFALADEAKPQSRHEDRHAAHSQEEHRHGGMQHMGSRHQGMQERHKQMAERHAGHEGGHGQGKPNVRERHGKHDHS